MQLQSYDGNVREVEADAVVVGLFRDGQLAGAAGQVDEATGGALRRLLASGEITGRVLETTSLLAPSGMQAGQVLVVGLGDKEAFDAGIAAQAAGAAAKALATRQRKRVAYGLGAEWTKPQREHAIAGALAGCTGQDLYRAEKKLFPPAEVLWPGDDADLEAGRILGEAVNWTRRMVNLPAADVYPASFADMTAAAAGDCGLEVEIWDEKRLADERCGALLAVAQGSSQPARLVILRHRGSEARQPELALVGKGVTFDSGGLSLKTSEGMTTMKCDMAGAATVCGAMQAIAKLELPVHVVALAGLVENLTGPSAYKLGDVLHTRQGTTIEVLNTDAEGRLVLADVLDVAVGTGAAKIVDLATLTGACMVALGLDVAGLMTNDQAWCDQVAAAAKHCGEPVWQLPMLALYNEQIESKVADIKNIGEGRFAGAITAAKLLERFVAERPWTHIDIAGPSFRDKPKPWCDAGASGQMVRTLVELARLCGAHRSAC